MAYCNQITLVTKRKKRRRKKKLNNGGKNINGRSTLLAQLVACHGAFIMSHDLLSIFGQKRYMTIDNTTHTEVIVREMLKDRYDKWKEMKEEPS